MASSADPIQVAAAGRVRAPQLRVALMVPERALLEALAVGLHYQGLHVVSAFDTSAGLLEGTARAAVDVVLLSGLTSRIGAVALARAMHVRYPGVRVALLVEDAAASIVDFESEPIDGVLRASLPLKRVTEELRRIVAGERVMPPRWLAAGLPPTEPLSGLSRRQREILELIATGHSTQEIAGILHVTLNTVKYHVRKMYERLHVRNRAQAVRVLFESREDLDVVRR
jgi:two-component system nitrate/nitrite response regulator NarP